MHVAITLRLVRSIEAISVAVADKRAWHAASISASELPSLTTSNRDGIAICLVLSSKAIPVSVAHLASRDASLLTIAKELIQRTGMRTVILIAVVVAVLLPVTSVVGRDALVCVAGELSRQARDLSAA